MYKKRIHSGRYRVTLQEFDADISTWQRTDLENAYYNANGNEQFPVGAALGTYETDVFWSYMWHGLVVGGSVIPPTILAVGESTGNSDILTDNLNNIFVVFEHQGYLKLAAKPSESDWITTTVMDISSFAKNDVGLLTTTNTLHILYRDTKTAVLTHTIVPYDEILPVNPGLVGYRVEINNGDLTIDNSTVEVCFSWESSDGVSHYQLSDDGGFGESANTTEWHLLPNEPWGCTDFTLRPSLVSSTRNVYLRFFRAEDGQTIGPLQDDIYLQVSTP